MCIDYLDDLPVSSLKCLCKKMNLQKYSKLKKKDLIILIKNNQNIIIDTIPEYHANIVMDILLDVVKEKGIVNIITNYMPNEKIKIEELPLKEKYIIKNKDKFDWFLLSQNQKFTMKFIKKYQDYIVWFCLMERNPYIRNLENFETLWELCHENGGCCMMSNNQKKEGYTMDEVYEKHFYRR